LVSSAYGYVDPDGLRFVSTLSAVAIPMFALGFLFYLQAMKGYGALVRMVFKIIESTKAFLAVLVILIFGYSASFNLMTLTDHSSAIVDDASWNTYAQALLSSTLLVMGVDVPIDAITETHYAAISVSLLVSFMLLMAVILLNLLIAIMSDKHGEVKAQERASANYNRAGIVVEYEKLMSAEERKKPEYSPIYLQVLRPERVVDEVINSAEEIKALQQLMHDKTDYITDELQKETSHIRKMIDIQEEASTNIKNDFIKENIGLREMLDMHAKHAASANQQLKEENAELRKLLETQMQSTTELKDMLVKMMAAVEK
jgi:hypothetical protein